jgi:ribosomal protein S18 acetylase RimI-like enzyme
MSCEYCGEAAVYKCSVCGRLLCSEHSHLRVVCASCEKKNRLKHAVRKADSQNERRRIREFVTRFWGEEEQLTFNRKFIVAELPAYVAKVGDDTVGFVSFANMGDAVIIVALAVLPQWQGAGVGKSLVESVEAEAKGAGKKKLLVSTSNDDLPALAFYQAIGFQIFEVKPNVISEKHGKTMLGVGGLPVRDELRLQKTLR